MSGEKKEYRHHMQKMANELKEKAAQERLKQMRDNGCALSDWDVGQDLCFIQDTMFERTAELPKNHPAKILVTKLAGELGDYFDKYHNGKSHGFGIFNSSQNNHTMKGDLPERTEK